MPSFKGCYYDKRDSADYRNPAFEGNRGYILAGGIFPECIGAYSGILHLSHRGILQRRIIYIGYVNVYRRFSSSTGGGIKTTTFVVLVATVVSISRGRDETVINKRRVDKSVVYRAMTIVAMAFLVIAITSGVIMVTTLRRCPPLTLSTKRFPLLVR